MLFITSCYCSFRRYQLCIRTSVVIAAQAMREDKTPARRRRKDCHPILMLCPALRTLAVCEREILARSSELFPAQRDWQLFLLVP